MKINIETTKNSKQACLTVITDEGDMSRELTVDEIIQALLEKVLIKEIRENILEQMCRHKKLNHKHFIVEEIGLMFRVKM